METKTLPLLDAKALDDGHGGFTGYGSVFGGIDSYGDQIAPGAYAETLGDFLRDGFIAWGHDWAMPVATPTSAVEDTRGLLIRGEFHSDPDSQRARIVTAERLARGKSMGLSIGYEPLDTEYQTLETPIRGAFGMTDQLRILKRIKLFEVSLVTVPADEAARVTDAKGLAYRDHADRVLADVRAFVARSRDLSSLRAKEGRVLSEANRQRLASLLDAMRLSLADVEELLVSTEPAPKGAAPPDPEDGSDLYAEFLRITARAYGVAV